MMCEQSASDQLVTDLVRAENAGFDFSVISDHYQPWLPTQGHSGYDWSILGAAAWSRSEPRTRPRRPSGAPPARPGRPAPPGARPTAVSQAASAYLARTRKR